MHDLVGVVLPLKWSGDTPFQGMSPINVGDLRQVSQVNYYLFFPELNTFSQAITVEDNIHFARIYRQLKV